MKINQKKLEAINEKIEKMKAQFEANAQTALKKMSSSPESLPEGIDDLPGYFYDMREEAYWKGIYMANVNAKKELEELEKLIEEYSNEIDR